MRGVQLLLLAALAACGERGAEAPQASESRAIARSVEDIRAAEAAMAAPVVQSKSIAELTRPAGKTGDDSATAGDKAGTKAGQRAG
jgi:hypothetical protein